MIVESPSSLRIVGLVNGDNDSDVCVLFQIFSTIIFRFRFTHGLFDRPLQPLQGSSEQDGKSKWHDFDRYCQCSRLLCFDGTGVTRFEQEN